MTPAAVLRRLRPGEWLKADDPWRELGLTDWTFVLFAWLTVGYLVFIVAELLVHPKADFDFMPVAAGVFIVPIGWLAVRLRNRTVGAVDGLDDGAALSLPDEGSFPKFQSDFAREVRRWKLIVSAAVLIVIVCGFIHFLYKNGMFEGDNLLSSNAELFGGVVLGVVMVSAAAVIGSLLGSLVGYGLLHRVMARHHIALAGLATPQAREAVQILEGVFGYAVLATSALCQWLGAWLLAWNLGFDSNGYAEMWYGMFAILWPISFALFLVAGLFPSFPFQRRIDALYGGTEARLALDRQIADANRDRAGILAGIQAGNWRLRPDLADLDRFIQAKQERQFRSPLLRPPVLYGVLACNLALIVAVLVAGVLRSS